MTKPDNGLHRDPKNKTKSAEFMARYVDSVLKDKKCTEKDQEGFFHGMVSEHGRGILFNNSITGYQTK